MKQVDKKHLKSQAHHLKPVVIIGAQGLSTAVHAEIDTALNAHELIKIRVNAADKAERESLIAEILVAHQAELIQIIGHVVTIYRQHQDD